MTDIKLKPCPFCGREPEMVELPYDYSNEYFVRCTTDNCVEQAMPYLSKEEAAEKWNRRAGKQPEEKAGKEWRLPERELPPDGEEVLVLTQSKKGIRNIDKGYWAIDHFIHRGTAQVIGWMRLPEIYLSEEVRE